MSPTLWPKPSFVRFNTFVLGDDSSIALTIIKSWDYDGIYLIKISFSRIIIKWPCLTNHLYPRWFDKTFCLHKSSMVLCFVVLAIFYQIYQYCFQILVSLLLKMLYFFPFHRISSSVSFDNSFAFSPILAALPL